MRCFKHVLGVNRCKRWSKELIHELAAGVESRMHLNAGVRSCTEPGTGVGAALRDTMGHGPGRGIDAQTMVWLGGQVKTGP